MNYTLRLPVNVLFGFLEVGMKPLHNKRVGRRMEVIRNDMRVKMDAGLVERTIPDQPKSRLQKYRRRVGW